MCGSRRLVAVVLAAILGATPAAARAESADEDREAPEEVEHPPLRSWGLGTLMGAGVLVAQDINAAGQYIASDQYHPTSGFGVALLLPTVETQLFFGNDYSIDWSAPLVNIVAANVLFKGFFFNSDFFFNPNIGTGRTRFILSPGLGFSLLAAPGTTGGSVRIPAQIGWEYLAGDGGSGFKFLLRPWMEIDRTSTPTFDIPGVDGARTGMGFGMLLALGFSGYRTR